VTKTKIDWADYSWNPVWGCRNSCPYCYARALARRFGHDFEPTWKPKAFASGMPKDPGQLVFVNSMSDPAFWERDWIRAVLARIHHNPQHQFAFLTKAPWGAYWKFHPTPANIWWGVTATDEASLQLVAAYAWSNVGDRMFVSLEPLHGPVTDPTLSPFSWVIVGAETGNRKDRIAPDPHWIENIIIDCDKSETPLWMKNNLRPYWSGELIQQRPV